MTETPSEFLSIPESQVNNDPMTTVMNSQVGGDHYKKLGLYQPWYVYSKWFTPEELKGAMKKEVLAYLQREASKGGREDIKKAHHTLGIYLELTKDQD